MIVDFSQDLQNGLDPGILMMFKDQGLRTFFEDSANENDYIS